MHGAMRETCQHISGNTAQDDLVLVKSAAPDDVCFSEDIYPAGLTVALEALQKLWSAEMNRVWLGRIQNTLPKQSEAQLFSSSLYERKSSVITGQTMRNLYVRVYPWLF